MAPLVFLQHRWRPILLGFLLLGAVIYLVTNHAETFLSYLEVIIWPCVFLLFFVNFKFEISNLIRNIKQVEILGNNLTIGTKESLDLAIEGAAEVALKANESIIETPSTFDLPNSPRKETDTTLKRDTVERIIRSSAEWGYSMALLGFKSTPIPQITWNENDSPQIEFGIGSGQSVLNPYDQADRDLLIKEILRTRRELESLGVFDKVNTGFGPTKESSLKAVLEDLEMRLRRIDPTSTFLPISTK